MDGGTSITPIALSFFLLMAFLTVSLRGVYSCVPLLVLAAFMPLGQVLVVGGLNFHLFRLLLVIGILRVLIRGEARILHLTSYDRLFIVWIAAVIILGTLTKPSLDLFISRVGEAFNAGCTFFFLRCFLRTWDDRIIVVKVLAFICIPLAILLTFEKLTGRNILSVFGGVPEFTVAREGRLRCQGAFRHPILTGTFGATLFPLCVGLWFQQKSNQKLAVAACIACLVVIIASASSGPVLAWMGSCGALLFWKYRTHMRAVRWSVVGCIIGLALVMNAPVYYLLARISEIAGGTGWHRAYLIEVSLRHLSEWWLFGTTYTAHWGPGGQVIAADPNHMDITNHFIMEGIKGGLLRLVLFVALIWKGFQMIGKYARSTGPLEKRLQIFSWCLGASLFSHCLSFISVPYFDQIIVFWYLLLASIACLFTMELPKGLPLQTTAS